ncbi:MAG TPA: LysE family translocator [Oxalobacteraceae bacterium]|jgi:threonine/homoserine/homoserine lactone efflux protein|nr:LysE family translocator [Oxalobacteraceae bacterium]
MQQLLPAWPLLAAFLIASLVLAVTPGPAVFYIVTRTLAQGRAAGLASMAGVALGNLGNAFGASLGLAALFAVSSVAFMVVKYAGAAYLVYLGLIALRPTGNTATPVRLEVTGLRTTFRDGLVVALFNPKTTIFFAAFLPQFMRPDASTVSQSMVLGCLFVAIAALTDTGYVLAAGAFAPLLARLRGARNLGRYLKAGAFIGLGIFTAASGARSAK